MKTIGLLGGITWHSTLEYYRFINEGVQRRLGGSHSARCILYSVDFDEVERLQETAGWDLLSAFFADAAKRIEAAGAELLVICANTMHRTADAVEAAVSIPLVHIADATAAEIGRQGLGNRRPFGDALYDGTGFPSEALREARAAGPRARRVGAPDGARGHLSRTRARCDSGIIAGAPTRRSSATFRRAAPKASSWAAPRSLC